MDSASAAVTLLTPTQISAISNVVVSGGNLSPSLSISLSLASVSLEYFPGGRLKLTHVFAVNLLVLVRHVLLLLSST